MKLFILAKILLGTPCFACHEFEAFKFNFHFISHSKVSLKIWYFYSILCDARYYRHYGFKKKSIYYLKCDKFFNLFRLWGKVFSIKRLATFFHLFLHWDKFWSGSFLNFFHCWSDILLNCCPTRIAFELSIIKIVILNNDFIFTEYFHWSSTSNYWKSPYQHFNEYTGQ